MSVTSEGLEFLGLLPEGCDDAPAPGEAEDDRMFPPPISFGRAGATEEVVMTGSTVATVDEVV